MSGRIKALKYLGYVELGIVCVLISTIILSIFTQVVTRYLLTISISWLEELARFSFLWAALYGGSIAYRRKALHKFDLPFEKISPIFVKYLDLLRLLLVLAFFGILVVYGMELSIYVYQQFSPALKIRMTYVYLAIPVSMGLMFVYTVIDIFRFFTKGNKKWR